MSRPVRSRRTVPRTAKRCSSTGAVTVTGRNGARSLLGPGRVGRVCSPRWRTLARSWNPESRKRSGVSHRAARPRQCQHGECRGARRARAVQERRGRHRLLSNRARPVRRLRCASARARTRRRSAECRTGASGISRLSRRFTAEEGQRPSGSEPVTILELDRDGFIHALGVVRTLVSHRVAAR